MTNEKITCEDKIEHFRNEQMLRKREASLPTTYHKLAGLADDLGGRFAVEAGEEKATKYPRQDTASPWSGGGADPGVEPPTGVAIDAMEPTGEFFEVERSIEQGEPEPDASRVDQSSLGVDHSGSPAELAGDSSQTPAVVGSATVSSPVASRRSPANPIPPDAPDDGLADCPRREDGWPLSSHAIKPRRKITG